MKVLAFDPSLSEAEIAERGGEKIGDLHCLLAAADAISLMSRYRRAPST